MARIAPAALEAAASYFEALSLPPPPVFADPPAVAEHAKAMRQGSSAGFFGGRDGATTFHKALPAYLGGQGPGGWASNHFAESQQVVGWAFCAVRAIARTCARAERKVYATGSRARKRIDKATKDWKRDRVPTSVYREYMKSITAAGDGDDAVPVGSGHPLLQLINRPNPFMSAAQFLFQYAQQVSVTGTALLWTRRNGYTAYDDRGTPSRAYIIPTGIAVPLPPGRDVKYGAYRVMPIGSYGGAVTDDQGFADAAWSNLMITGGTIDGRQIRPVRWPHPLFLTDGQSPMAAGELWIDIANQLDRATWSGFKNTLRPGRVFQMAPDAEEPTTEELERFTRQMEARSAGIENVGKNMMLPKGVSVTDKDTGVSELDYANGRQVIGRDVLALWATPPVATGVQEAGAYAAYFASLLQFSEQAVAPVLDLLSDDATHEWAPAFGDELEVKYTPAPINDAQQKLQELGLKVQARSVTYNELRKQMGDDPWPEPYGSMQVGKDIPAPWEMDQINTDLASGKQDLEAAAAQADAEPDESGGNAMDTGGGSGNNGQNTGKKVPKADAGAGPPRSSGPNPGRKALRRTSRTAARPFTEVPGYFPRGPVYVPSGVVNGEYSLPGQE